MLQAALLTQMPPVEHVVHAAWSTHHYVRGLGLEFLNFTAEVSASDAGVAGRPHVVTQSQNDLLDLRRRETSTGSGRPSVDRRSRRVRNICSVISKSERISPSQESVPKDGMPSHHSSSPQTQRNSAK